MSSQQVHYQRLVGFGEAMLRLSVPPGASMEDTDHLDVHVGGAELNGLIAAARCELPATWISAVPHDALGRRVLRHARSNGVAAVNVLPAPAPGARLGLYFLEMATSPRPHRILYDRRRSAFAELEAGSIAWDDHLDAATCLYVSGISPPLGDGPRKEVGEAVRTARRLGATVALDVNYRSALWSRTEAADWLAQILPDVDVLSAGPKDLHDVGLTGDDVLAQALEAFDLRAVVSTTKQQTDTAVELEVRAVTRDGEHHERAHAMIVDPLGAGDALFGTFLARLPVDELDEATRTALGAAVSCYGLHGDALTVDAWRPTDTQGVIR